MFVFVYVCVYFCIYYIFSPIIVNKTIVEILYAMYNPIKDTVYRIFYRIIHGI